MTFANRLIRLACLTSLVACGDATDAPDEVDVVDGVAAEDPELGKALFDPAAEADAKEDSLSGRKGLPASVEGGATQVWTVRNKWTDTDTADAKKAGMAWAANSNLTWDEKYSAWIKAMVKVDSESYFETYTFVTPWGKTLPAPAVECAETLIFLRATFASWYALPFILEATDRHGKPLYLGHFGFRTEGGKYANSPDFRTAYKDYSDRADSWESEGWPTDEKLRRRKLGGSQDDYQNFLFEGARAGAYFDEIFLNKRAGYFMVYALSYFGSMNLADPKNMFNLKPRAVREGDGLLERWQRRGIGHTLVVKNVTRHAEDALEVELVSGSMPRRQGKWESASASKSYFVNEYTGGLDTDSDGTPYAKYGGGLKRWRIPQVVDGRWRNNVPPTDAEVHIDSTDTNAIGERLATFERILREVTPDEKRDVLNAQIEDARNHLRQYPASCSARIRREEAYAKLYDLESEHFGRTRKQVDAESRTLEDYVFAELDYETSKTCCWNSTTSAMYEIAMQKAAGDVEDHSASACLAPTVFKNADGGYDAFKAYAEAIGRGGEWVAWSEDEPCAQRDVENDTEADHGWTPWCEVGASVLAR